MTLKRILVINPFGIGDTLFTLTLVEALRKALPGVSIGFLCNERTRALVKMDASVDRVFIFNRDLMRRLWRRHPLLCFKKLRMLLGEIGEQKYDAVFDVSLGRQYSFFMLWLGIPQRIGFNFKGRGLFLTHKLPLKGYEGAPVADIQLSLLDTLGLPRGEGVSRIPLKVDDHARKDAEAFLRKSGISESDALLAVAPGGGKSWGRDAVYKQWDPERFADVTNALASAHGFKVLLLGDKSEEPLLSRVAGRIAARKVVAAGESFDKVCALLLRSRALLCNDGGLMHLANALGVRTVSVFGPVDERVYGPYGEDAPHAIITQAVPCRPCYSRFHFPACPYERRCLADLSAEKVLDAARKVLSLD